MSRVGVVAAIDEAMQADEKGHRPHLGASVLGKPCERALVYGFRHCTPKATQGRMLRLFNRGHREEVSLVAYLRRIGMEVREFAQRLIYHPESSSYHAAEWDDPQVDEAIERGEIADLTDMPVHVQLADDLGVRLKQWSYAAHGGHHAGSTDGKARVPLDSPLAPTIFSGRLHGLEVDKWFGLEFKTYNAKQFEKLLQAAADCDTAAGLATPDRTIRYDGSYHRGGGVRAAKPEHYSQVQCYMHHMGLDRLLYLAACKNDDHLYEEVIFYDRVQALADLERAKRVIEARQLPTRISNRSTNFECKFCDHSATCHFANSLAKSCRSCRHGIASTTADGAEWTCEKWSATIPKAVVPVGCDQWSPITD